MAFGLVKGEILQMNLVKVSSQFFSDCIAHGTDKELLFNKSGRPCILIMNLKYKGANHKFAVPLRSNIAANVPKEQYFALPPNSATRSGNRHGVHYIKIFPIDNRYLQKYRIENNTYLLQVKSILEKNEKQIINACQEYLTKYEQGLGHYMTPDIDGILSWL